MSFSGEVKEELSHQHSGGRHCQIAELSAMISMCGGVSFSENERIMIRLKTENPFVVRKFTTLVRKLFHAPCEVSVRRRRSAATYIALVRNHEDALRILQAVHVLSKDMEFFEDPGKESRVMYQRSCCQRAFLRGAFLSAGSISDPKGSYHFEIVCQDEERAQRICTFMSAFELEPKEVKRKEKYVVYLKEGDQLVSMLGIMDAPKALMELENVRILKEIGNDINRKVNCETANLNKTIAAAQSVIRDIEYLKESPYWSSMDEQLKETAELRIEHPDVSLAELAGLHKESVGKSGVNHRLKKLSTLAARARAEEETAE